MRKYNPDDLIGKTNQRITVRSYVVENNQTYLICDCSCGNSIKIFPYQFVAKSYSSCGCKKKDQIKEVHKLRKGTKPYNYIDGRGNTPLYNVLCSMISRCEKPNNPQYKNYGARGIKVCDEWHDFKNFHDWSMSSGYKKGLTIDRIDVNGNYCPTNCRWVTNHVQQRNRSNNIFITYNGKTQVISDWADELGLKRRTVLDRYHRGCSVEEILSTEYLKRTKSVN